MKKQDIFRKLTSRKFWVAVAGFITAICIAFGVKDITTEQIITVISASSVLVAYIIGEGVVDSANVSANKQDSANKSEV